MSVFFLTGCRVSAVTGACVGHLETDGVDHYLNVTEKRNQKRRKILLDAARPVLAYVTRAGIKDDREGPLFRPMTPDGAASSGGTSTARPPGGWSRNTARPPASTPSGWAAAASASIAYARRPSTTPSATGLPCTRCGSSPAMPTSARPRLFHPQGGRRRESRPQHPHPCPDQAEQLTRRQLTAA